MSLETAPTTATHINGTCPFNWVAWGSDCYAFPETRYDYVDFWNDAVDKCQQLGGGEFISKLASVHSEAENKFIYNTFAEKDLLTYTIDSAYIGFTQDYGKYQ